MHGNTPGGIERLAGQMLIEAWRDIHGFHAYPHGRRQAQAAARAWVQIGESGRLTFDFCCQVYGIDPVRGRQLILARPHGGLVDELTNQTAGRHATDEVESR